MSTTTQLTLADLRRIDLFDESDDAALQRWVDAATVQDLPDGAVLAEQGELAPCFHLVLEGTVRAFRIEDGRAEPRMVHRAPTWMGAIPLLTENPIGVRMVCDGPCRVACIATETFIELAMSDRVVHRRIMRQFGPVIAKVQATEQSRERLAGLGTMAAGLAHELNNPAAAAKRAASDLVEALDTINGVMHRFVEAGVEREDAAKLIALQQELIGRREGREAADAFDAADAEDELTDLLDDLGVTEGWRLAEPLAAAGADAAWLQRVGALGGDAIDAMLQWTAATLTARDLACELKDSATRMSDLVGAMKTYAYMDRGDLVEADVHEGLWTTITLLKHKLKHTNITLQKEVDKTLPKLMVHGGELNQVWTNLLDNAIQAIGDEQAGTITLRTRIDGPCVLVEIEDDGPGIPPEVLPRVFEPFFTTKGVGQGTGLGLDTVHRIVVERHGGSISVDSEPGRTTFHVWLPIP